MYGRTNCVFGSRAPGELCFHERCDDDVIFNAKMTELDLGFISPFTSQTTTINGLTISHGSSAKDIIRISGTVNVKNSEIPFMKCTYTSSNYTHLLIDMNISDPDVPVGGYRFGHLEDGALRQHAIIRPKAMVTSGLGRSTATSIEAGTFTHQINMLFDSSYNGRTVNFTIQPRLMDIGNACAGTAKTVTYFLATSKSGNSKAEIIEATTKENYALVWDVGNFGFLYRIRAIQYNGTTNHKCYVVQRDFYNPFMDYMHGTSVQAIKTV